MASIGIRFAPDSGAATTGNKSVSQANLNRILTAYKAKLGFTTDQQLADYLVSRLMRELIEGTKRHEKSATPVNDIPIN